jgi:ParB family transcriptional regulator, chromosome partitioning protein
MDNIPDILPFGERRYEEIPVEKIKVINSRDRDREQFEMNVESIDHLGLLKPIRVNDKFLQRSGSYELICGEGRLLAHNQLGQEVIVAEIVTCTRKEAYLQSLVENIARTNPRSMEFARELKRLHDEGWDFKRIAGVACRSESYVREYIRLVEQGEERLIHGVDQGVFPIQFAVQVASSDDGQLQNVLMDAFDEGIVTTNNFAQARRLITARAQGGKRRQLDQSYTVQKLQDDIVDVTNVKTSYVREAKTKENRFITLLGQINLLWHDQEFLPILRDAGLCDRPDLSGDFTYESSGGQHA